jgi:hypothetical protein
MSKFYLLKILTIECHLWHSRWVYFIPSLWFSEAADKLVRIFFSTIKHIGSAMDQVSNAVFPHRKLEIQRLWMVRGMKKPYNQLTEKTAVATTKINNCLPVFSLGLPASKLTDQEVVGLLEWSLPSTWRKKFGLLEQRPSSC